VKVGDLVKPSDMICWSDIGVIMKRLLSPTWELGGYGDVVVMWSCGSYRVALESNLVVIYESR